MFGNQRFLLDRDILKPKSAGQTLARLAGYFKPFWAVILLAVVFMVFSTWAQVTNPELTGQVVDCFLAPPAADAFSSFPLVGQAESASQGSGWLGRAQPAPRPPPAPARAHP